MISEQVKYSCDATIFMSNLINGEQCQLVFGEIDLKVSLRDSSFVINYQNVKSVGQKRYLLNTHLQVYLRDNSVIYLQLANVSLCVDRLLKLATQAKRKLQKPTPFSSNIYYLTNILLWLVGLIPIWFIKENDYRYIVLIAGLCLYFVLIGLGINRLKYLSSINVVSAEVIKKLIILSCILPGFGTYILGVYLMRYDLLKSDSCQN